MQHAAQNSKNKQTKFLTLATIIFGLKMMVKSGLDFFFILKSYVPLQRYLFTCQANSAISGRFVLALGSSNSEGARRILKQKILDHFSSPFFSQKQSFQESTYSSHSSWCGRRPTNGVLFLTSQPPKRKGRYNIQITTKCLHMSTYAPYVSISAYIAMLAN